MKADELIMIVDSIKENQVGDDIKLRNLNEVEGRVFCEILKGSPTDYKELRSTGSEMSVPVPYARMYVLSLLSLIAFANGEYDLYTSLSKQFEEVFGEYARFCIRNR